jgi:hypothetical protein
MIQDFRERYPMGSLLTDLLRVEEGIYIVKAQVSGEQHRFGQWHGRLKHHRRR